MPAKPNRNTPAKPMSGNVLAVFGSVSGVVVVLGCGAAGCGCAAGACSSTYGAASVSATAGAGAGSGVLTSALFESARTSGCVSVTGGGSSLVTLANVLVSDVPGTGVRVNE